MLVVKVVVRERRAVIVEMGRIAKTPQGVVPFVFDSSSALPENAQPQTPPASGLTFHSESLARKLAGVGSHNSPC